MTTIIYYNVNGIRDALKKSWAEWIKCVNPDIIGLQETKAHPDQLDLSVFKSLGYYNYWYSAEKKGYSGVALLTKEKPLHVEYGFGIETTERKKRKTKNRRNKKYGNSVNFFGSV